MVYTRAIVATLFMVHVYGSFAEYPAGPLDHCLRVTWRDISTGVHNAASSRAVSSST